MVKRIGKQSISNDEVEFMAQAIQDLCEFTSARLESFIKKYPHRKEYIFVNNVVKNYVGNMLIRGCKSPAQFKSLAEDFIDDFKDFMQIYLLDKTKTTGEVQ